MRIEEITMKNNVMIDLETLGTRPGSMILSVGAVLFDLGEELPEDDMPQINSLSPDYFYEVVDVTHPSSSSLMIDPATVMWWFEQSPTSKQMISSFTKRSLADVLMRFRSWFLLQGGILPWGNGSDFDISMITEAYNQLKSRALITAGQPWEYYNSRDVRTLVRTAEMLGFTNFFKPPTPHVAVLDAWIQTINVQRSFRWLQEIASNRR